MSVIDVVCVYVRPDGTRSWVQWNWRKAEVRREARAWVEKVRNDYEMRFFIVHHEEPWTSLLTYNPPESGEWVSK